MKFKINYRYGFRLVETQKFTNYSYKSLICYRNLLHCYKKYKYWCCYFCYKNKATEATSCCNLGYSNRSSFVSQERFWGNKREAGLMADWIKNNFHKHSKVTQRCDWLRKYHVKLNVPITAPQTERPTSHDLNLSVYC